jgi:hypothetical protein
MMKIVIQLTAWIGFLLSYHESHGMQAHLALVKKCKEHQCNNQENCQNKKVCNNCPECNKYLQEQELKEEKQKLEEQKLFQAQQQQKKQYISKYFVEKIVEKVVYDQKLSSVYRALSRIEKALFTINQEKNSNTLQLVAGINFDLTEIKKEMKEVNIHHFEKLFTEIYQLYQQIILNHFKKEMSLYDYDQLEKKIGKIPSSKNKQFFTQELKYILKNQHNSCSHEVLFLYSLCLAEYVDTHNNNDDEKEMLEIVIGVNGIFPEASGEKYLCGTGRFTHLFEPFLYLLEKALTIKEKIENKKEE